MTEENLIVFTHTAVYGMHEGKYNLWVFLSCCSLWLSQSRVAWQLWRCRRHTG